MDSWYIRNIVLGLKQTVHEELNTLCHDIVEEKKMKKCHACGQKLPLKVGDVVEAIPPKGYGRTSKFQGTVVGVPTNRTADLVAFDGARYWSVPYGQITRLHGYYRITEREPLS